MLEWNLLRNISYLMPFHYPVNYTFKSASSSGIAQGDLPGNQLRKICDYKMDNDFFAFLNFINKWTED